MGLAWVCLSCVSEGPSPRGAWPPAYILALQSRNLVLPPPSSRSYPSHLRLSYWLPAPCL